MSKREIKKYILIATLTLVSGLLLLQLVPYARDQDNPPVLSEPDWDSQQTRDLAERACFDCHSNETEWPWYSQVAPLSMLVWRDVVEGREALNFSEWGIGETEAEDVEEIVEQISTGQMPPTRYLLLNPGAELSELEQTQLINGIVATVGEDTD